MAHPSLLSILPKFLWKPIMELITIENIEKISDIVGFTKIFDDDYCKKRLLCNTTWDIIVVVRENNGKRSFWNYALINYRGYHRLFDLFEVIRYIKFAKFTCITVFMKPGTFQMDHHGTYSYDFHDNNCSVSIIGSTYG